MHTVGIMKEGGLKDGREDFTFIGVADGINNF